MTFVLGLGQRGSYNGGLIKMSGRLVLGLICWLSASLVANDAHGRLGISLRSLAFRPRHSSWVLRRHLCMRQFQARILSRSSTQTHWRRVRSPPGGAVEQGAECL